MCFANIRKEKGFTQEYLARLLGVKQSTVAMWETGKSFPTMKNMLSLSNVLQMDISEIVKLFPKIKNKL